MYGLVRTRRFVRSYRKLEKSGLLKPALKHDIVAVIDLLAGGLPLPAKYHDHQLQGEFAPYRECHIRGDILLVYQQVHQAQKDNVVIVLVDIGTHANLFE